MNTRDRVHFASQSSVCLNSLSILHLDNDELMSSGAYDRLAINNVVVRRFVLRHQQPDYYIGKGGAVHPDNRSVFGERVAVGIYCYRLPADEVLLPMEDSNPQIVKVCLKSKRSDSVSDQKFVDRIESLFLFFQGVMVTSCCITKKVRNLTLHPLTISSPILFWSRI